MSRIQPDPLSGENLQRQGTLPPLTNKAPGRDLALPVSSLASDGEERNAADEHAEMGTSEEEIEHDKDKECEEKCCPAFWEDDGVPRGVPVLEWVFDPNNKLLNENECARQFGDIGHPYADKNRKKLFGIGIIVTALTMVITGFGCFAISSDQNIVQHAMWGYAYYRAKNETADGADYHGVDIYLGLRALVVRECSKAKSQSVSMDKTWGGCDDHEASGLWEDVECSGDGILGFSCDEIKRCKEEAVGNAFGAFTTCATMIFAMLGLLTRIRRKADSNFQKVIGCVPDTIGVFTLGQALVMFASGCAADMPAEVEYKGKTVTVHYWPGPGYFSYWACWLCQVLRVVLHWVTPVPDGGHTIKEIRTAAAQAASRAARRSIQVAENLSPRLAHAIEMGNKSAIAPAPPSPACLSPDRDEASATETHPSLSLSPHNGQSEVGASSKEGEPPC